LQAYQVAKLVKLYGADIHLVKTLSKDQAATMLEVLKHEDDGNATAEAADTTDEDNEDADPFASLNLTPGPPPNA
jgi:hypothetical protein